MKEITKDTNKDTQQLEQIEQPNKTFTQEEVNRIVSDRLARDRERRTAELDEREKAVKARELAVIAAEKLAAAGLPKELSGVLRYDDEATLDSAIKAISNMKGFANGNNSNSEGKRIYKDQSLPDGKDTEFGDPIKNAFRPVKE